MKCKNQLCSKGTGGSYDLILQNSGRKSSLEKYYWANEYTCEKCHAVYYKCSICHPSSGNSSLLYRSALYRHHMKHKTINDTNNSSHAKKSKIIDKEVIIERHAEESEVVARWQARGC